MDSESQIALRIYEVGDFPLISDTFGAQLRDSPQFYTCESEILNESCRRVLRKLLERWPCIVATPKWEPSQILAWIIADEIPEQLMVVPFAYVKAPFRRMGILRHMLSRVNPKGLPILYPFRTRLSAKVGEKLGGVFDPFCLMKGDKIWQG